MSPDLVKAHRDLDRTVDRLDWKEEAESELERSWFLLREYQQLMEIDVQAVFG